MIVLVFGGRTFNDFYQVSKTLNNLGKKITLLVQGGAPGADNLGKAWASQNGVHYAEVPALWSTHGNSAGFKRNNAMALINLDCAVMFPGGSGTINMYKTLISKGVKIIDPLNFAKQISETL